jgi:rRNA pseudouridine-1189 N-methylase Emg1 (Nep1/Mra1 family)
MIIMPKKKEKKKKHGLFYNIMLSVIRTFNRITIFIIEIPYFIYQGIRYLLKFTKQKKEKTILKKKRETMIAKYEPLILLNSKKGKIDSFEKMLNEKESTIGIIIGSRGSGKSAFGMKIIENIKSQSKKKIYAMGFEEKELPLWIINVDDINQINNDSWILIDEGGILFSSRKSMSNANKLLSELILIARHKGLSILFISQNSSNLDVNILRQADFLILRQPSLLQLEFERDVVKKLYEKYKNEFEEYKNIKGLSLVYSNEFTGFASNSLPSFWTKKLSTSFRNKKDETRE